MYKDTLRDISIPSEFIRTWWGTWADAPIYSDHFEDEKLLIDNLIRYQSNKQFDSETSYTEVAVLKADFKIIPYPIRKIKT
jgi:hypothetical protein